MKKSKACAAGDGGIIVNKLMAPKSSTSNLGRRHLVTKRVGGSDVLTSLRAEVPKRQADCTSGQLFILQASFLEFDVSAFLDITVNL